MSRDVSNEKIEKWRNIWHDFCLSNNIGNIKNQISIVKRELGEECISKKIDENEIKQIECIYPSCNVLVLLENGLVYLDGKLYRQHAKEICVMNPYESYIIYNDNMVETFTSKGSRDSNVNKYKKVICKHGFLATLETNGNLSIIYAFENMGDELAHLYFEGVDNIECEDNQENMLVLEKNGEKIKCSISVL